MGSVSARSVLIPLEVREVPTAEACSAVPCPACGEPLDLHQPDLRNPDRLLGTCTSCGAWALLDLDPEAPTGRIVRLPSSAALRDAAATRPRRTPLGRQAPSSSPHRGRPSATNPPGIAV